MTEQAQEQKQMNKNDLEHELTKDLKTVRSAMREMLSGNRTITNNIMEEMGTGDEDAYVHIEEYMLASKNIIDASKVMQDLNNSMIKAVKEIRQLKDETEKLSLDDLLDDE